MEEKLDLEEKKNELNKQIELICGFGELSAILNDFEVGKTGK